MENWVIAILVGGLGIYFLVRASFLSWRGLHSRNWHHTIGEITEARLRRIKGEFEEDPSKWQLVIAYTYQVNGQTYQGQRHRYGDTEAKGDKGKIAMQQLVDAYLEKPSRTVFYNPDDPQQAVLERGFRPIDVVSKFIFGVFFVALAIALRVYRDS